MWDYYPSEWTKYDDNFVENQWIERKEMAPVREHYKRVARELDALIAKYGYVRDGRMYRVKEHSDKTVVIFCHFGVSMMFLSHLLNLPAEALLHGLILPPTSVTVLNTEERVSDEAYFRAERIGDTCHLLMGKEPISESGYFTSIFQEV